MLIVLLRPDCTFDCCFSFKRNVCLSSYIYLERKIDIFLSLASQEKEILMQSGLNEITCRIIFFNGENCNTFFNRVFFRVISEKVILKITYMRGFI